MSKNKHELLDKDHQREYYNIVIPELSFGQRLDKRADDLVLPGIGDETDEVLLEEDKLENSAELSTPDNFDPFDDEGLGIETTPSISPQSNEDFKRELEALKQSIQDLKREERLDSLKEEIISIIDRKVQIVDEKIEDIHKRKVLERTYYDTDNAYKEHLFGICSNILDEILIPLIPTEIDYSLVATQITSVYDDGTVENGLVNINVMIPYNNYRYDFNVELPVLGGVIQSPVYLKRGQKIIPLTEAAIIAELESFSFKQVTVDNSYVQKGGIFNHNLGENVLRKPNNQKHYDVNNNKPNAVSIPPESKWITNY